MEQSEGGPGGGRIDGSDGGGLWVVLEQQGHEEVAVGVQGRR